MCAAEQHTCCPFSSFTIITVACLGLFGPSAFVIDQKTKEIVDRKVLGATVTQILPLISKEFLILVFLSFAISIPFTWWVMTTWLQSFAYRIQIVHGRSHWPDCLSLQLQYLPSAFRSSNLHCQIQSGVSEQSEDVQS